MFSTFRHRKHYHLVFLIQALLFGTTFPQRHIVHIHTHEPGCLGRTQAPRPQRIYISQVCQSINIKHLIAVQLLQTGDVPHTTPHPTSQTITFSFCQASSNLSKPTDQNLTTAAVWPEKLKQLQTVASSSNKAEKKGFRGISVGNIQLKHWIKTNKIHSTGYFKPVITSCGRFGGGPVTEWEKLTAVCFIVRV